MSMNGVTRTLTTVNRVTRSAGKVFIRSLPILTVAANVADIASKANSVPDALNALVARYTGFNTLTGEFRIDNALKGAGSLIGSVVVSKIVQMFM